jgi:hypothetical protein
MVSKQLILDTICQINIVLSDYSKFNENVSFTITKYSNSYIISLINIIF